MITSSSGGRIFMQLWHCGRIGARGILGGEQPLSRDDLGTLEVYAF